MASNESSKTVFLAMSVNFSIGIAKSVIATITMSSAMFSEAIHSFVDTGNQFLLWFGIKQSKKIILDLKVGPAEDGVKRPCIIPCKPKHLDKTNKGIKDLDDQIKSGLESKAGGAVKRKCKDYPIKDEEENIGKVIVDILDIFLATLASLSHGIKSANVLYANCQDLLEYLSILSTLPKNANYEVHALKLDTWLTILQSMNINGYINQELTDNQVREMKIDFYDASNALKKFRNSKSKEKQHGC